MWTNIKKLYAKIIFSKKEFEICDFEMFLERTALERLASVFFFFNFSSSANRDGRHFYSAPPPKKASYGPESAIIFIFTFCLTQIRTVSSHRTIELIIKYSYFLKPCCNFRFCKLPSYLYQRKRKMNGTFTRLSIALRKILFYCP